MSMTKDLTCDPQSLIEALHACGLTLATAESLTGGALCARLVDVPGASAVLRGGVCTYSTDTKAKILGVPTSLLDAHGPVHAEVAQYMAQGVRSLLGADLALATTGVAGPGPADGHDAGTVFIALAWPGGAVTQELHLEGDRQAIRNQAVNAALALLSGQLRQL